MWCLLFRVDRSFLDLSGMPTVDGYDPIFWKFTVILITRNSLRKALLRVDAGPNGHNIVHWTSLREVPSTDNCVPTHRLIFP